jgi:hypothetical protein
MVYMDWRLAERRRIFANGSELGGCDAKIEEVGQTLRAEVVVRPSSGRDRSQSQNPPHRCHAHQATRAEFSLGLLFGRQAELFTFVQNMRSTARKLFEAGLHTESMILV